VEPAPTDQGECLTYGCERPAARRGLCWSCIKREQRGSEADGPPRPYGDKWRTLTEAALAYADLDTSETGDRTAFQRVRDRLRKAAKRYRDGADNVHNAAEPEPRGP
jgi:hypothetical protein